MFSVEPGMSAECNLGGHIRICRICITAPGYIDVILDICKKEKIATVELQ